MAAHVEPLGTLGGEEACLLAGVERLGQNVEQPEGQAFRCEDVVELTYHLCVVGLRGGVNGNHARGIAHAEDELARHLPVHITCQCGEVLDAGHVLLVVEDGLVEVADAPAQGDVVVEEFREFGGSLARVGVAPGAEGHQYLLTLVEGHVAVHHGREADGGQGLNLAVILTVHVLAQVSVAVLQAVPDGLGGVGPQTVYQLVLPLVRALCDGFVVLVDEDGLDTGRAKLDTENGFT